MKLTFAVCFTFSIFSVLDAQSVDLSEVAGSTGANVVERCIERITNSGDE